jgi:CNT family concentrative nucleoside transporter
VADQRERKAVRASTIATGVLVQFAVAGLLLYVPFFKKFFLLLNDVVLGLEAATKDGTSFVFGYLGGGTPPFMLTDPGSNFILAFQALPLVLIIGALSALLFHWKVLSYIVKGFPCSAENPEYRRRTGPWRFHDDIPWTSRGSTRGQTIFEEDDAQ